MRYPLIPSIIGGLAAIGGLFCTYQLEAGKGNSGFLLFLAVAFLLVAVLAVIASIADQYHRPLPPSPSRK